MRHTDDNNLLSNGKDAAAAAAREKIKAGHDHLQEVAIGELLADGASKSVLELGLKRSTPGLLEAIELRLFGSASKSAFLRRLLALVAKEKAEAGPGLKARMREWAKYMGYGEAWRDYTTAVCDGNEPGDDIALELLVHELHLHVVLHKDDGSVEKEIKCEGTPLAKLHLVRAASTFCTLIVPHHLKGKQAMPADNVPDPPTDWVSPVVGERVEVDVEDDGWCSAEVLAVLPGQLKVQLKVAPNNSDGSVTPPTPLPMDDWLTWEQEGTEWWRTAHASPVTLPASPVTLPASPVTVHASPTRLIDAAGAAMPSIGGGASPSDGGGVVVEGGLKTRPRGRAPTGKVWNGVTGAWEEDPGEVRAQAQAERAQAMAAQPTARSEAGGDGLTDLSPLLETAGALKERMAKPVPAPADAPELSLKPPGQLAKMAALFAQCDAVAAEGVAAGAEAAALLEAVRAKESALHARMRTLESEEEQKEEELQRLKGLEASLQREGCNTRDVRAKLGAADSGLEQLQGELHACGQALAVLQTLPEELEQQVPTRALTPALHPTPPPPPPPSPPPLPAPQSSPILLARRRRTRTTSAPRWRRLCPRSCRAARRRFPPSWSASRLGWRRRWLSCARCRRRARRRSRQCAAFTSGRWRSLRRSQSGRARRRRSRSSCCARRSTRRPTSWRRAARPSRRSTRPHAPRCTRGWCAPRSARTRRRRGRGRRRSWRRC